MMDNCILQDHGQCTFKMCSCLTACHILWILYATPFEVIVAEKTPIVKDRGSIHCSVCFGMGVWDAAMGACVWLHGWMFSS